MERQLRQATAPLLRLMEAKKGDAQTVQQQQTSVSAEPPALSVTQADSLLESHVIGQDVTGIDAQTDTVHPSTQSARQPSQAPALPTQTLQLGVARPKLAVPRPAPSVADMIATTRSSSSRYTKSQLRAYLASVKYPLRLPQDLTQAALMSIAMQETHQRPGKAVS